MTPSERILAFLRNQAFAWSTQREIAKGAKTEYLTVHYHLKLLEQHGLIDRRDDPMATSQRPLRSQVRLKRES